MLHLSQKHYIVNVLKQFDMKFLKSIASLMNSNVYLMKLIIKSAASVTDTHCYQLAVRLLMYIMTQTRPDIVFAVFCLSQYCHSSDESHWQTVKWVLWYLHSTSELRITYRGSRYTSDWDSIMLGLHEYSDSDWKDDIDHCKLTTEYVFFLAEELMTWSSKHQLTVTLSSTEAEYMTLTQMMKKTV